HDFGGFGLCWQARAAPMSLRNVPALLGGHVQVLSTARRARPAALRAGCCVQG
ncbi:hypothetical protein A2U01_0096347, partial [Trifolium medium]|nr:hypothetical protein [Trifolium medium]